tara:strand:+ start:1992 stop:2387 length:396 start_codon:yes stop_codon:yes gene_type:complete
MAEEYDNTNSGAMFSPSDIDIIRQGMVDIEGEKNHMLIVKNKSREGDSYYNMYKQVGKIYETDKKKETDSDMDGSMQTAKGDYKFWLRKKTSQKGVEFTSVSLAPKRTNGSQAVDNKEKDKSSDLNDEIPF